MTPLITLSARIENPTITIQKTFLTVMDININDSSNDGEGGGDIDGNSLVASRQDFVCCEKLMKRNNFC